MRTERERRRIVRSLPAVAILALIAATTIYPLLFVGFTAFKTEAEYAASPLGPPSNGTTEFVRRAWEDGNLDRYLLNSAIVVVPAVAIIAVASLLAGYALSHGRFRGRGAFLVAVIAMMTIPSAVLMIPVFRTVEQLGLLNSYAGLILVYAALNLPLSIYLVSAYLRRLPRPVLEAAAIDGAGELRVIWTVVVPLAVPVINTLVTLNFLWLWNELLFGLLILQDPEKRVTTVGLAALEGNLSTPVPLLAAGLLISLVPVMLVFFTSQRRLARGIAAGAVK